MEIKNLPVKYNELWAKCSLILQKGRPDDITHAIEVAEFIINCGNKEIDLDVLIPVSIMHDIGHSAILPGHFKYVTGTERVANGKLVHMLVGAKIAKETLESIGYDKNKIEEIVDIISMHDSDQLDGIDVVKIYGTENKRIFHDIDCMDRYNLERLKKMEKSFPDKNKMWAMLEKGLETFFDPQFKDIAQKKLEEIKNEMLSQNNE